MADGYSGLVRILDEDGVLLAVGSGDLSFDPDSETWTGMLELVPGSGVAGKALVVEIEIDGKRGKAQLTPIDNEGDVAHSRLVGLGPKPF